ncbi:hypothetical protein BH10ACT8_BH10ACT8_09530 [soil metagenome]
MCTWTSEQIEIAGQGRGVSDWIHVSNANISYDHPAIAPYEHALLIDFVDPAQGVGARIAVELDVTSAHALMRALQTTLATPQAMLDYDTAMTKQTLSG